MVAEAMWQMTLGGGESMEHGPFPERIGEPDCSYYMRTGLCRFGATCKFNHPPNRKLVASNYIFVCNVLKLVVISITYCSTDCWKFTSNVSRSH